MSSSQSPLNDVIDELSFLLPSPSTSTTTEQSSVSQITFNLSEEEQALLDSVEGEERDLLLSMFADQGINVTGLHDGEVGNETSFTIQLNQSIPTDEVDLFKELLVNQSEDSGESSPSEISLVSDDVEEETCRTEGGADVDKDCVFPFTFQGRNFTGCTFHFGVSQSWCSTETDSEGHYMPGRWGYCSAQCPLHHHSDRECLTVSGPATGNICVFPFFHERMFHWGCTEREGGYWCPTLVDDHAELVGDNWGWCRHRCREQPPPPCQSEPETTTALSESVDRMEKSFEIIPTTELTTTPVNEEVIFEMLPEDEKMIFLQELYDQETTSTSSPDIFDLLPEDERELLMDEILEQEYTEENSEDDLYDLLPDSEKELLFTELLAQETTTEGEEDVFELLPEHEKEMLMAEILDQEETEATTLSDEDIFAAIPENEKEMLASLLLSDVTTSGPVTVGTCNSSDTCQGRCGGGSDLSCWCDSM